MDPNQSIIYVCERERESGTTKKMYNNKYNQPPQCVYSLSTYQFFGQSMILGHQLLCCMVVAVVVRRRRRRVGSVLTILQRPRQ
jgi:hypothetical protein